MLDLLAILHLTLMASVFGYAVSASVVAHPAMMDSSREVAVGFFKPFFHNSAHLQLILSLIILGIALLLGLLGAGWIWFAGAAVLQLNGPCTIKILMPVNNHIMADGTDIHTDNMGKDLNKLGQAAFAAHHSGRSDLHSVCLSGCRWQ